MKNVIVLVVCLFSSLHAMNEKPVRKLRGDWKPGEYSKGNARQQESALGFMKRVGIDVRNKRVLDAGCGTGNVSEILSQTAASVHGIDAEAKMIDWAIQEYEHIPGLTFECCFAEDFTSTQLFDIVVSFMTMHWVEDKAAAFKAFSNCLEVGGEFFGDVLTQSDPVPSNLQVFMDMSDEEPIKGLLEKYGREEILGVSYPTVDELKYMLADAGFEIISMTQVGKQRTFKDREDVVTFQRPILMSRPFAKEIPDVEVFFERFIDNMIAKFKQNEDGTYTAPPVGTTLVYARKI